VNNGSFTIYRYDEGYYPTAALSAGGPLRQLAWNRSLSRWVGSGIDFNTGDGLIFKIGGSFPGQYPEGGFIVFTN